jgi:hypothetical protein
MSSGSKEEEELCFVHLLQTIAKKPESNSKQSQNQR